MSVRIALKRTLKSLAQQAKQRTLLRITQKSFTYSCVIPHYSLLLMQRQLYRSSQHNIEYYLPHTLYTFLVSDSLSPDVNFNLCTPMMSTLRWKIHYLVIVGYETYIANKRNTNLNSFQQGNFEFLGVPACASLYSNFSLVSQLFMNIFGNKKYMKIFLLLLIICVQFNSLFIRYSQLFILLKQFCIPYFNFLGSNQKSFPYSV